MAPAESACSRCGAPAPEGRAALLLLSRADQAQAGGRLEEAVSLLDRALHSGLPQGERPKSWRKLGLWLEKLALEGEQAQLLARAGQAFSSGLNEDDSDEIAHQLFIANLARQGKIGEAKARYQRRLDADPGDAMAQKQLGVIRLSADFLAAPPKVSLNLPPRGVIERWLQPKGWKLSLAISTLASSLVMLLISLTHSPGAPGASAMSGLMDSSAIPVQFDDFLFDPWSWAFQGALSALALYFMYRNRKP
jgi:tetratricopeptide (TPR) repeat protein